MDDSYRFYPTKWMIHTDSIQKKWMIHTDSIKKKMIHTDSIQKTG